MARPCILGTTIAGLVLIIVAAPSPAHDDIGIPMVFYTWGAMLLALIPVIGIEAFVLVQQLSLPWLVALKTSLIANGTSTLIGIPLTFLPLHWIKRLSGNNLRYRQMLRKKKLLLAPWHAPGIVMFERTPRWLVSSALLSLLPPLCVASWLIEYPITAALLDNPELSIGSAVLLANIASYSGLFAVQVWNLRKAIQQDRTDPFQSSSFKTANEPATPKVSSLAISADGGYIATGHEETVRVWDRHTGKLLRTLRRHQDDVETVSFSQDGTLLAAYAGGPEIVVRDWKNGKRLTRLPGEIYLTSMAFSSDGRFFAAGFADDNVLLWRTDDWNLVPSLEDSFKICDEQLTLTGDQVDAIAFSSDSRHLGAVYNHGPIRIWDLKTFKLFGKFYRLPQYEDAEGYEHFAIHPTKPLFIAIRSYGVFTDPGRTTEIHSVSFDSPAPVCLIKHVGFLPRSISFNPDGSCIASICDDARVRFWDSESGELTSIQEIGDKNASGQFISDGRYVILSSHPDATLAMRIIDNKTSFFSTMLLGDSGWLPT